MLILEPLFFITLILVVSYGVHAAWMIRAWVLRHGDFARWLVGAMVILAVSSADGCAHAAEVTPELVCKVQNAIRFQAKAWAPWMCLRVAKAINAAAAATDTNPATLLAIATNESDLRPDVRRSKSPEEWTFLPGGKYLVTEKWIGTVYDGGLMGVRCRIGDDGRCSNGLVKGWKWPQTMVIENNVMLGARILAASGSLRDYNGQSEKGEASRRRAKRMTYTEKIHAIKAALEGRLVEVKGPRMRELIRKIVGAVRGEERT